MEYQTWRVQGFYPWNKIEELKNLHRLQISSSVILNSISSISPREVSKSRTIFLFIYNERNLELIRDFGCSRKVIGDFNIDDKNLGSPLMKMTNTDNGKIYRGGLAKNSKRN